ncbi:hypothetical protein G6O67_004593 [Ophiocordyceps sinensis]|uniref:Uncharacterized protein n=1 Tax=Ophiocordyceps sinensis TaxID=72228 RepID=A0A8H4PPQ6_9HYPO|nr:hypothetical protein G6O67_004593 [Ophiocordyceps sinensis]
METKDARLTVVKCWIGSAHGVSIHDGEIIMDAVRKGAHAVAAAATASSQRIRERPWQSRSVCTLRMAESNSHLVEEKGRKGLDAANPVDGIDGVDDLVPSRRPLVDDARAAIPGARADNVIVLERLGRNHPHLALAAGPKSVEALEILVVGRTAAAGAQDAAARGHELQVDLGDVPDAVTDVWAIRGQVDAQGGLGCRFQGVGDADLDGFNAVIRLLAAVAVDRCGPRARHQGFGDGKLAHGSHLDADRLLGHVLQRHLVDLYDADVVARGALLDGKINGPLAGGVDDVLFLFPLQHLERVDLARDLGNGRTDGVGRALVDGMDALVDSGQLLRHEDGAAADEKDMDRGRRDLHLVDERLELGLDLAAGEVDRRPGHAVDELGVSERGHAGRNSHIRRRQRRPAKDPGLLAKQVADGARADGDGVRPGRIHRHLAAAP